MNIANALDHLFLIAADDHVSAEDGSYLHPLHSCETCYALEEVRKLGESLKDVAARENLVTPNEVPETIELDPLEYACGEGTTLTMEWEIDQLSFNIVKKGDGYDAWTSATLELDALTELRDSIINPAIEHGRALERAKAEEAERVRIEWEAKAEERAREQAERERAQSFRAVSVTRTVTPNMTVHGRVCASLAFARKQQTLGTLILALTPDDLIGKLPTAMTGRLNLRFCAKCKPIPGALRFNAELVGAAPEIVSEAVLLTNITRAIWEGHDAALNRYDEERSKA